MDRTTNSNRNQELLEHFFDNTDFDDDIRVTSMHPLTKAAAADPSFATNEESSTKIHIFDECQNFMIVAAVLGCLLIAASVMMCILSHRLYNLTKRYKREKLDDVVREHRRKFGEIDGSHDKVDGQRGGGNNGGVLSVVRVPQWRQPPPPSARSLVSRS